MILAAGSYHLMLTGSKSGSFDSSVHISEETSNATVAVPWAIVSAIGIAGVLGWGIHQSNLHRLDVC